MARMQSLAATALVWCVLVPATAHASASAALRDFSGHIDLRPADASEAALALVRGGRFQPRPGVPPWPIEPPIDWNADPFGDPNWRFQLHAWRMFDPMMLAYLRDGDTDLLDRMLVLAADWKHFHLDQAHVSEFADYDMALGLRAQRLAWLWLALGEAGAQARRDAVIAPLVSAAMDSLLAQLPFSDTNHGLFQVHGLLALCRTGIEQARCATAEPAALAEFQRLLQQQFGADFAHVEHSPAYHFFALRTLERMRRSGWYADAIEANRILDGARDASAWLVDPAGKLFSVGDSDNSKAPLRRPPDRACALKQEATCYVLKVFGNTGWAVARSDWGVPAERGSALFVQASHHSDTHKHADDLSFVWFDRGRNVLVDPGRFGYVDDPLRDYMISTRAHNALEIDGRNQRTGPDAGRGTAVTGADVYDGAFVVQARATYTDTSTRHRRAFKYRPQHSLVIADHVVSPRAHALVRWFQFTPDATLLPGNPSPGTHVIAFDDGTRLQLVTDGVCTASAHRSEREPRLQGWITSAYARAAPTLSLAIRCNRTAASALMGAAFVWQDADIERARDDMQQLLQQLSHTEPRS